MSVRLGYDGEMSVIIEGVFISRYRACRDRDFLLAHGVTHIINCAAQSCESHFRPDFQYLDLPMKDEPLSEEQIHLPLTPLQTFIPKASAFIQQCLDSGGRVVVHCRKGISRSVSIVAGYMMTLRGANLVQALTLIRERRKVADPNVWFVENLKIYQHELDMQRLQRLKFLSDQKSAATSSGAVGVSNNKATNESAQGGLVPQTVADAQPTKNTHEKSQDSPQTQVNSKMVAESNVAAANTVQQEPQHVASNFARGNSDSAPAAKAASPPAVPACGDHAPSIPPNETTTSSLGVPSVAADA